MTASNRHPGSFLPWVRDDLDTLIAQLSAQVEHLASVKDVHENALKELAQRADTLHHTLRFMNIHGAATLTGDLALACEEIHEASPARREVAFNAAMEALVVLPAYLDRLQSGLPDLPLLLMPTINALREARRAPVLQEAALFSPPLDIEIPELDAIEAGEESTPEAFKKLHLQFDAGLHDWLQDQGMLSALSPLRGVCEAMLHTLQRKDLLRLWWIASEIIGGIEDKRIANDRHMRRVLSRLELCLKSLGEEGESAVSVKASNALSHALLYRAASAKAGHRRIDLLRRRFSLKDFLPDQAALLKARGVVTGKDRQMYEALGIAVKDELTLIKDTLDLHLQEDELESSKKKQCREALARLQDTLLMLGLGNTASIVRGLISVYEASTSAETGVDSDTLMTLAEHLLIVESEVAAQVESLGQPVIDKASGHTELAAHEFQKIKSIALNEALKSIQQFEDSARKRLDGEFSTDVQTPLEHVTGALKLIGGFEEVVVQMDRLRHHCESWLGEMLSDPREENPVRINFTDAVAALELFITAQRDQRDEGRQFIEILQGRMKALRGAETTPEEEHAQAVDMPEPPTGDSLETEREVAHDEPESLSEEVVVLDPELLEIFLEEYEEVAENLNEHLPLWLSNLNEPRHLTEVRRAFHTLKGSGRMVGALELGDFCWQIEEMLNSMLEGRIQRFADAATMVRLAQAALPALKQRLMNQTAGLTHDALEAISQHSGLIGKGEPADWHALHEALPGYLASMLPEVTTPRPAETAGEEEEQGDFTARHREEFASELAILETLLDAVALNRNTQAAEEHVQAANQIAELLSVSPKGRDVEVAQALETALLVQRDNQTAFNPDALWTLGSCFAYLQFRLEQLEGDADAEFDGDEDDLIAQLEALQGWFETSEPITREAVEHAREEAEDDSFETQPATPDQPAKPGAGLPDDEDKDPAGAGAEDASLHDDITIIYLEEAREVLGRCDSLLNTWRDNLFTLPLIQNLQREVHTLKGGARMAGLLTIGDLAHAMEELLERTAAQEIQPTTESVEALEQGCDQLLTWVEEVARGKQPEAGSALSSFLEQVEVLSAVAFEQSLADIEPEPEEPRELKDIPDADQVSVVTSEESQSNQIRVDADLLDVLIKSAGEINIFRTRLERQVSTVRANLTEFNETIARLREQFRKLDMETEAQIRSRYRDTTASSDEEFDPLEMDRFSSMQQLSRGLSESVADLLNLGEILSETARQSDTLLVQQSRVSTELQEGLMQTRMVPFGSIAPRLRRLVRTACKETKKKAQLQLLMAGSSDDLDRNVLEHMTSPLEHMLRNAIAHGIESPATRKKAGKDPEGMIRVTVESEATEFVIRIEDDGAGINSEAIRLRAIERGLLDESSNPPAQQLYDLILTSGFSTSETVTGLAGRGVGMDVVASEVKQIGGSLEINSDEGKGTRFVIRIPFTLAVMQAIGVTAGEQRYFIPLTSVAGVARITPADYEALVKTEQPAYQFAEESYPVLELEPLLGEPSRALGNDNISLLMIKAGEQRAAFRVPELLGHREVVIKPVGAQITSVPGILGGTVLGDGRVVLILDPGPIIRQALLHNVRPVIIEQTVRMVSSRTTAMVVDDSITMRKVNSRVLEGMDIEAITAKDGQDAVDKLQERVPDVMLLDIEMPRMDGYQLAEYIRSDARLRAIPIVMITSRSGQKHRDRAMEAGANAYLTKPYKETDLVDTVKKLLREAATHDQD